jgi:hypothetical protein
MEAMLHKIAIAVIGLGLCAARGVEAQEDPTRAVLRSAGRFIRDSLIEGPIVIDNEMFRSRPALSDSATDLVARVMGVARRRFDDAIQCDSLSKRCAAGQKTTVLAIARPTIYGDSADLEITWARVVGQQLVGVTATLTLRRQMGDLWQVRAIQMTGSS